MRHIKGVLPVVYKPRYMDISTRQADEIMFATGNANKLKEVGVLRLCHFQYSFAELQPLQAWPLQCMAYAGSHSIRRTSHTCTLSIQCLSAGGCHPGSWAAATIQGQSGQP